MASQIQWTVELIRLTTFHAADESPDSSEYWSEVVGSEPDTENKNYQTGQIQKTGQYEGAALQMTLRPGRADWIIGFVPQIADAPQVSELSVGGDFDTAFASLQTLAHKWLDIGPSVIRIAVGVVLLHPVDGKIEGYTELGNFLHNVTIDPENSSDFNYQINLPRPSKRLDGQTINRLSKWVVRLTGLLKFSISSGTHDLSQIGMEEQTFAVRAELDLSTSERSKDAIPQESLHSLVDELVENAVEIANEGDIP